MVKIGRGELCGMGGHNKYQQTIVVIDLYYFSIRSDSKMSPRIVQV